MDLNYIDYISISGRSWLHRSPAGFKILFLSAVMIILLSVPSWRLPAIVTAVMITIALSARLPLKLVLALSLYPVIFIVIFLFSVSGLTLSILATTSLRIISITLAVVIFFLSTSFPAVFAALGRILPDFLVTALFFTYRSIFLLSDSFADIYTALHLRGGIDFRRPVFSFSRLGMALGHFLGHIIAASQRMADNLKLRGFHNRIYYLGKKYE
ncbi:MAG: CbiQ family ECF transporter T component [bacterium]|nr:CbiQ family ECF transporter T component [bacterium]MDD3805308.1 CbiQ family ECF transporter T component [bacterium]MDD4558926.1 CbiQ family ECF transporter T component [bacterium]